MAKHVGYLTPALKKQTMNLLEEYKKKNPHSVTPMADAFAKTPNVTNDDRMRFVRSAKALGWKITKSKGKYYENGVCIWA